MNTEVRSNETTNEVVENILFEEDIEAAVDRCAAILGPQGRYLPSGNLHSIRIYSPEFGILWYGDITVGQTHDVQKLSKEFQTAIAIVRETHWDFFCQDRFNPDADSEYFGSSGAELTADAVYVKGVALKDRHRAVY